MKPTNSLVLAILLLSAPLGQAASARHAASAGRLAGDYVEFRNADVYTGPCFANSEVGLTGTNAVLAWHIRHGNWAGRSLSGLSVVAVIRSRATLGDPYESALPARAVVIVDSRATKQQRAALIAFARAQSGDLLNHIVAVERQPITFSLAAGSERGRAVVTAGNIVKLTTRSICSQDHFCHNEEVFYHPLAVHITSARPAVVLNSVYRGGALGVSWNDSGRRSSFVGTFAD